MKSIFWVVSIMVGVGAASLFAEDAHAKQMKELEAIKAELKPLRERAYLESDVIATRRKLDEAYKIYWDSVRTAMIRLDPSKQAIIEKDVASRKSAGAVAGGSRAADYEKKAAQTGKKAP